MFCKGVVLPASKTQSLRKHETARRRALILLYRFIDPKCPPGKTKAIQANNQERPLVVRVIDGLRSRFQSNIKVCRIAIN